MRQKKTPQHFFTLLKGYECVVEACGGTHTYLHCFSSVFRIVARHQFKVMDSVISRIALKLMFFLSPPHPVNIERFAPFR
jgi:hypothetical protein